MKFGIHFYDKNLRLLIQQFLNLKIPDLVATSPVHSVNKTKKFYIIILNFIGMFELPISKVDWHRGVT